MQTLTNDNNYVGQAEPLTAAGKPAPVDGLPKWTADHADPENPAFTLEPQEDGSVRVITHDAAQARIGVLTVEVDADLGEGVTTLTFSEELVVGPPTAESVGFRFTAEPKQ